MQKEMYEELLQNSVLIPPMDIFEAPGTHEEVVRRLIRHWAEIAARDNFESELTFESLSWLLRSLGQATESIAFHGSAIYAAEGQYINDIDVVRFTEITSPQFSSILPQSVNVLERNFYIGQVFEGLEPTCTNSMILYSWSKRAIERRQAEIERIRQNSKEILDMLVVIALGKIMKRKGLDIKSDGIDKVEIERCARSMDVRDFREMTDQALRRMRVKQAEIPRIADQFVRQLRKARRKTRN